MMRIVLTRICLVAMCLTFVSADVQDLTTYDTFNGHFIDPAKWVAGGMCLGNGYDCAREVREGHLRLAARGYGDSNSDAGVSFSATALQFPNPAPIHTIEIRFAVRSFSSAACPTNMEAAHPQQLVFGSFFNSGTGNPADDVVAYLLVERRTDDALPATSLRVGGFMSTNGQFFNNVGLGTVEVGERVTATLHWDRLNKAFVVRVVKSETTPHIEQQTMQYSQADNLPPSQPFKTLQVGTFAPNCTAARSFAEMDSRIYRVAIN